MRGGAEVEWGMSRVTEAVRGTSDLSKVTSFLGCTGVIGVADPLSEMMQETYK